MKTRNVASTLICLAVFSSMPFMVAAQEPCSLEDLLRGVDS